MSIQVKRENRALPVAVRVSKSTWVNGFDICFNTHSILLNDVDCWDTRGQTVTTHHQHLKKENFTRFVVFILRQQPRLLLRMWICYYGYGYGYVVERPISGHARTLGSLSTRVFETRTATGREHFACQGSGISQIFILIISHGEKILSNVNVVV